MSPPSADIYPHGPTHGSVQPIIINPPVTGAPSTPPETPPVGSPNLTINPQNYPAFYPRQPSGLSEDMMFLPQAMRANGDQPLDLRPLNYSLMQETAADWDRKDYVHTQTGLLSASHVNSNSNGTTVPPYPYHHLPHLEHGVGPLNMHNNGSSQHHHHHHLGHNGTSVRPHSVGSSISTLSPRLSHHRSHHRSHHHHQIRDESVSCNSFE